MRQFARWSAALIASLFLAASVAPSFAFAAAHCADAIHDTGAALEHHYPDGEGDTHRHDQVVPSCIVFPCCAPVPNLSAYRLPAAELTGRRAARPASDPVLAGRTLRPDPSPPRSIA